MTHVTLKYTIKWLYSITQRVQDAAARLLCDAYSYLLGHMHHLFETLMFNIQHGISPQYLAELCDHCNVTRLRSATRGNFAVRQTRLRVSDKAFSVAEPRAWNALPTDMLTDSRLTFRKKTQHTLFLKLSY